MIQKSIGVYVDSGALYILFGRALNTTLGIRRNVLCLVGVQNDRAWFEYGNRMSLSPKYKIGIRSLVFCRQQNRCHLCETTQDRLSKQARSKKEALVQMLVSDYFMQRRQNNPPSGKTRHRCLGARSRLLFATTSYGDDLQLIAGPELRRRRRFIQGLLWFAPVLKAEL